MKKLYSRFPTRFDANRDVQPQKVAKSLKFPIEKVEGLIYLCSENEGAVPLRGNREADLRQCKHKGLQ